MNKKLDHSTLHTERIVLITFTLMTLMLPLLALDVFGMRRSVPNTGELIMDLQDHEDQKLRQRAAWWLGEHEDRRAVMDLIDALRDESTDVRQVAAWALGEIKDEKAIAPLIWVLDDSDPLVREMVILSLGEIEDPSAVDPLVEISEKEKEIRTAVVWALGEIENRGSRKAGVARKDVFRQLGQRPWDNDQVWTGILMEGSFLKGGYGRFEANERAINYTEDVLALLRRLQDEDTDVRLKAAFNCGLLGIRDKYESLRDVEHVVDRLLETLRDPEPEVRAMAVWSLDEINPSRSRHFPRDRDHHKDDHDHDNHHHD